MSYVIVPEVAGGFGEGTRIEGRGRSRSVLELDYQVAGWLGDDIVTSHPVFLMSPELVRRVLDERLTGISDRGADVVSFDEQLIDEADRSSAITSFHWVDINGIAHESDFWINSDLDLEVSDHAWDVVREFSLNFANITKVE